MNGGSGRSEVRGLLTKTLGALSAIWGAEGRSRSADTAIFSRVLYQLSYLGSIHPSMGAVLHGWWAKQGSNL